jgi:hypothetical protein
MATRNTTGIERECGHQAGNRPRIHTEPAGRRAAQCRPTSDERHTDREDGHVLEILSHVLTGWHTTVARVDGEEMRIGVEP